ncbi:MAG: bacillithiol biosynthesis deacetylase BshB1 [candidate division Zixibacteria bacterium]|nr:bacillithiol biosynthesis deacetylase BshB1 [candidate division Zixibacteria bacterium]
MAKDDKVDVLAVGAHRDDVEITCGGTVHKLVQKGYKVAILDLTMGEMGSRGSAGLREEEADCAAKILGVNSRFNLGLPDAFIENKRENRMKAVKILRQLKPELLILPYPEQRHPDHRKTPQLMYDACHLSGLSKVETGDLEPHRPSRIIYSTSFLQFKPSIIIDITEQMDIKLKAVACYDSQFKPDPDKPVVYPPAFDINEFILTDARYHGFRIEKKYGEPFFVKETMMIDDPVNLSVRSI